MSSKGHILWADDEIEMLKPHIFYLENKGYEVTPVKTGEDAIHICDEQNIDLVLLDEMMTGLDGLTTLKNIKDIKYLASLMLEVDERLIQYKKDEVEEVSSEITSNVVVIKLKNAANVERKLVLTYNK